MSCLSDAELLEEVDREHLEGPHLRGCDSCQLRLAELRVAARMLRELRGTPATSASRPWGGRLGLIVTAASILAIAGVLVWKEVDRERSRKKALASAPEGDGASYDGEAILLTWGDAFGPLGGKEVRLYRRPVGGEETLLGNTRETSYLDRDVAPDRKYVYRIVPVGGDGKESKLSVTLDASTVMVPVMVGEFKIHFQQGFSFQTRQVVPEGEADLALTQLAGGFQMRGYTTPYGGTNGPDDDLGQLAPRRGLGKFEDLAELPSEALRMTLRTDERYPASLEVFALRTKGGGIAKVQVLGPEKGFRDSWQLHPIWIRYVYLPAGGRFLPTLEEVKDWPIDLDEPARKKAEGYLRDLSSGAIDTRTRAAARLKQMGPAVLPFLRAAAPEQDAEAKLRRSDIERGLALQCRPLQLALAASDRELREAAAGKLEVLLGEQRPLDFSGDHERQKLEERFEKERRERQDRLRKVKIEAVRGLGLLPEEARKKTLEQVSRWRDSQGEGREALAREVVQAGPGSAAVVADVLGTGGDAAPLIDRCLDVGKNLVFINSRSNPEANKDRSCYFSFSSGQHGYDGMVSIEFGNGGDTFQVQMYGGQKNTLADLGKVDFTGVKAPKAYEDQKDWEERHSAVVGHTYLEHVWEDKEKFYVKFKVLAMESGECVLILWERLGP